MNQPNPSPPSPAVALGASAFPPVGDVVTQHYVVTVTPTIMSGTVVRWFLNLDAAERCRPFLSASRYEVITHVEGITTAALREQANAVQDALQGEGGTQEWVRNLATHQRRGISGPIVPVPSVSLTDPRPPAGDQAPAPDGVALPTRVGVSRDPAPESGGPGPSAAPCGHACCSDTDPLHDHFLRPVDCPRCGGAA